jgi:hypothetical protein
MRWAEAGNLGAYCFATAVISVTTFQGAENKFIM